MSAKEKFDAALPLVNVLAIGPLDHGKSTLLAAAERFASEVYGSSRRDGWSEEGTGLEIVSATYHSNIRRYVHTDPPATAVLQVLADGAGADAAVLVVSAADSVGAQADEHLAAVRKAGIEHVVVFINKIDLIDEQEQLDAVEQEIRDLLASHRYSADTPVVIGSAKMATEGKDDSELGTTAVKKLLEAMDASVPEPLRPAAEGA
ncbi:GTP-binding protein [Kitasatospora sp. NPDC004240]